MNSYDPNGYYIYNQYLIYSGGIHPTLDQYNRFAQNFYYYQNPYIQMQYYQIPQDQENFIINVKQPEHLLQPTNNTKKNCDLNMECKDISCLLFHHPSLNKK